MSTRYQKVQEKDRRWKKRLYRWMPNYRFSNDVYEDAVKERLGEGVRWVDLGCGRNELVHELRGHSAVAFGLDRSVHPQLFQDSDARFVQGEVDRLPFQSGFLDLLTSNVLMEHLPDPLSALKEMHRCLKPGGYLIFRTPNARHILNVLLRFIPDKLKKFLIERVFGVPPEDVFPTYYRANHLGELRRLCREAGFDKFKIHAIEDIHTVFGLFFFLSWLYYCLVQFKLLAFLRTNFVVIAQKSS